MNTEQSQSSSDTIELELEVVWHGAQQRPGHNTKGELLGDYDCGTPQDVVFNLHAMKRGTKHKDNT